MHYCVGLLPFAKYRTTVQSKICEKPTRSVASGYFKAAARYDADSWPYSSIRYHLEQFEVIVRRTIGSVWRRRSF